VRSHRHFAGLALVAVVCGGFLKPAEVLGADEQACTCGAGRIVQAGMVSYSGNSDRESIVRIETDGKGPNRPCKAIWIGRTEILPTGTPYEFHLQRMTRREQRFARCDYPLDGFVKRDSTYQFEFDSNSSSIREMQPAGVSSNSPVREPDAKSQSNKNLWDSIMVEVAVGDRTARREPPPIDPTRELNRTSWVVARREIKAHYVGVVRDAGLNEKIVSLKRTRKIKAGLLGQVEAINDRHAIVRFYYGSRAEKFGEKKNALRRWYDECGGPYTEDKDDLYTSLRAEILEVALEDIIEVNDYLDQGNSDRTGP
jgi:hypothetical protein